MDVEFGRGEAINNGGGAMVEESKDDELTRFDGDVITFVAPLFWS